MDSITRAVIEAEIAFWNERCSDVENHADDYDNEALAFMRSVKAFTGAFSSLEKDELDRLDLAGLANLFDKMRAAADGQVWNWSPVVAWAEIQADGESEIHRLREQIAAGEAEMKRLREIIVALDGAEDARPTKRARVVIPSDEEEGDDENPLECRAVVEHARPTKRARAAIPSEDEELPAKRKRMVIPSSEEDEDSD